MGSGHGISLLIPFRANPEDYGYHERIRNFEWIKAYWHDQLPLAEFIHGHDESYPYSKTRAVNDAARRAHGDVFVILDADAYLPAEVLETAAHEIRLARRRGRKLWYVPYRRFYRLDREISEMICWSDPGNPLVLPDPPPRRYAEQLPTYGGNSDIRAHWYGALVQVMPREAFEDAGGMDERFAGWGSEDIAFMRAVDTLYGPHKTLPRAVCHLYHPRIGRSVTDRKWAGQTSANANWPLSKRYLEAKGDPALMRALVDQGLYVRKAAEAQKRWNEENSGTRGDQPRAEGSDPDPGAKVYGDGPYGEALRTFGIAGVPGRLLHALGGLPVESAYPAPIHDPYGNTYSAAAVLPHTGQQAFDASIGRVPADQRAGSSRGKGWVGRLMQNLKDGFVWLWSWYVAPVLAKFHRSESSPGDDA